MDLSLPRSLSIWSDSVILLGVNLHDLVELPSLRDCLLLALSLPSDCSRFLLLDQLSDSSHVLLDLRFSSEVKVSLPNLAVLRKR